MDYIKVKIETTTEASEALAAELLPVCPYCQIDDPSDIETELEEATVKRWDYLGEELFEDMERCPSVCVYLELSEDGEMIFAQIKAIVDGLKNQNADFYGSLKIEKTEVKSEDWENNWKQYYKPFNVGNRLLVRPSWEQFENPQGRVVLTMDPASSFGTGSHATTRLCMEQLDEMELLTANVLDIGCGSGILACTAMLLGAKHVTACDIEQNAMIATAENMEKNNIPSEKYITCCGNLLEEKEVYRQIVQQGPFDLILANIVADVLMDMSQMLVKMLNSGGVIILSGIIESRKEEVAHVYNALGLKQLCEKKCGAWIMFSYKK